MGPYRRICVWHDRPQALQPDPRTGVSQKIRDKTSKSKSPRLQLIHTRGTPTDPHLHGSISITPAEARLGTHKLVNIPWALQKRLYRVAIPPDVRDGTVLRLSGLGKRTGEDERGDLYLTVNIR